MSIDSHEPEPVRLSVRDGCAIATWHDRGQWIAAVQDDLSLRLIAHGSSEQEAVERLLRMVRYARQHQQAV
jgi:hypothetical protein